MPKKILLESDKPKKKDIRPALTPEARENQLIFLATELAEQQLRDGTASSQVITHYLKLGSSNAKTEALQSAKHIEELYANAIEAMKSYSGHGGDVDDGEY